MSFLTLADITRDAWPEVWNRAAHLKRARVQRSLAGKSVALVFEKASTRTRVSFEVGVFELGGHAVVLTQQGSQLGRGEPIEDTARVLSGYCHAIVLRTFAQARVEALARAASVPVVNGLSDEHHPCQVATDLFTAREHFAGRKLEQLTYAWIGDGNNMSHSWIEAAGLLGLRLRLACPEGFDPAPEMVAQARARGGDVVVTRDPREAVRGAHVVSTDVWASMGQEDDAARRRTAFAGFCVDDTLLAGAASDAIVLHCLPAHRGEEIAADVLDGPRSLAWVQAENRLHVGKALLEHVLGQHSAPPFGGAARSGGAGPIGVPPAR